MIAQSHSASHGPVIYEGDLNNLEISELAFSSDVKYKKISWK